jgi:hypothetical protein
MAKQQQAAVFSIEDLHRNKSKNKKLFGKKSMSDSRIADHVPIETSHFAEGINDEFYRILQGNPFMYSYKKCQHKAVSVEEFYIAVKKEMMPFGAVFRSQQMDRGKRSKWIKKAFKKWKSEFTVNKTDLLQKENDKVFVVGDVAVAKVSIVSLILMVLIIIMTSVLLFQTGTVWATLAASTSSILQKISAGVTAAFTPSWMVLVAKATFPVVITALFYASFHNGIMSDFKKTSQQSLSAYKSSSVQIEKDFKKKFKKTRAYYLSKMGKNPMKVAPLDIEKTAAGDVDFEEVEKIADSYVKKAAFLKRHRASLKGFRFITTALAYGCGLAVIGYTLYSIVTQFF